MNILFITALPVRPNAGGIERVTHILANKFLNLNHKIFYLSPKTSEKFNDISELQLFIDCEDKDYVKVFHDILADKKIDLIINQGTFPETLCLLRNKPHHIKLITVLHNRPFAMHGLGSLYKKLTYPVTIKGRILKIIGTLAPDFYIKNFDKFYKKNLSEFINLSDKLFLLSDLFTPRILNFMPELDPKKIDAVNNPNTFDLPDGTLPEKENIVLFVARLEDPQKNVRGFIDVWNKFHKSHPEWKALIVGDGPHRKFFEDYAKKKKSKGLEFLGSRKDVDKLYGRSKILCMTSLYEGWGMVLVEALAYGCIPVVYDTFESLHEIISDGENGRIIPPFDADKMKDALIEIADNENLRMRMANKGKDSIKRFEADAISEIWQKKFSDLGF